MKIALVRARYNPYGGAERFAARAMRAIVADHDHATDIAVIARSWQDVETTQPVRLIRCDPFYVGSVWRDASFAAAVHGRLATEQFDLVQSHERIVGLPIYRAGDGVHASWLERRARAAGTSTRLAIALNPHHRYLLQVERRMFEHPALRVVICNSTMVRDEIAGRFSIDRDKLTLIRNGVDLERFHPSAREVHRDAMRARLQIDDATTVFVMVGSGFERKGVSDALQALRACPAALLVVVGDDKHRRRYEAMASTLGVAQRVRFVGPVADTLPYHAMADCLLAPALYDPFPNAALEALACGVPVIASDACGVSELIDDDVNGWVVGVGRIDALQAAMQAAIGADSAHAIEMRRAARGAAEPHSLAALSSALLRLYRALLPASTARSPVINSPAA